jgi:hypothetical protein
MINKTPIMKSKLILCLAFVLSGGLFGCSTANHSTTIEQTNTLPLYVHFGFESGGSAKRFLSAQIRIGEPIFIGGDDYLELKGKVERQGTNFVADLIGDTGQESQFYRGNIEIEKPFFGQGGAASGGMGLMWFIVSTNSDSRPILNYVNASLRLLGIPNAPANQPETVLQSSVTNVPNQIDPNTGLPPGNLLLDPTTGLPLKHNKQP